MVDGEMRSDEFHEVAMVVYWIFGGPTEDEYIDKIISDKKSFQDESRGIKADVFYLISGAWKTSLERLFLWIGGSRPSQLQNFAEFVKKTLFATKMPKLPAAAGLLAWFGVLLATVGLVMFCKCSSFELQYEYNGYVKQAL
ncbi:unnamed protein product [Sphenostylis stenocarpa]|uniref:DOG1 domain-containing protein n=1 Tax=Sphenostylis stenocarpa TaxID=92480 RepID=A0AA86S4V2_9FABA|nr:unnamed protein product [Sphenostylis stenocarpa]